MPTSLTATEQRPVIIEAAVRRPREASGYKSKTAERLAKRVDEEKPRDLLEGLRQRRPVENPKAQHLIERNIAAARNPDGTVRRLPEQQRRFDEANKWNNLTQGLIEKGIDGLPPEQQKLAIEQVRSVLQRIPDAERLWWGLSVDQMNEEIRQLLKDPDFISKIRETRSEATGESQLIAVDVATVQAKLEVTKTKKEQAEGRLAQNNGERDDVTARLEQFEDRTATDGRKGARLEELERLEAEAPDLTARQEEIGGLLEETQTRIRDLENTQLAFALKGKALPELGTQLVEKRTEATNYRKEMSTIRTRLARREALQIERAELQVRKGQLEQKRIDLDNTVSETGREHSLAQAELVSISLERAQDEEEFVAGLRNVLRDGTFTYLESKIAGAEQTLGEMLDEEIAQTQDKSEKAFVSGIKGRYVGKPHKERRGGFLGMGAKEAWVPGLPKGEVIDGDYQKYLESGTPVPIVKALLEAGRDPTTGERLLTDGEVAAKLTDKEFVQKMGTRAIEELLKARLKTGEITENEAQIIVNYEWGAAAIAEAIHKNQDPKVREMLEELKTLTGERDERKLLAKLSGKSLLAILLMILGSAVAATLSSVNLKKALRQE